MKSLSILAGLAGAAFAIVFAFVSPAQAGSVSYDTLLNGQDDTSSWLQYSRTYDGHRFVRADQINRSNVHKLRPVWIFPTIIGGTHK